MLEVLWQDEHRGSTFRLVNYCGQLQFQMATAFTDLDEGGKPVWDTWQLLSYPDR